MRIRKKKKTNFNAFLTNKRVVFIASGLLVIWLFKLFIPILSKKHELEQRQTKIKNDIKNLNIEYAQLKKESQRLEQDNLYIEKIAREQLGLAKQGEVVYNIVYAKKEG